LRTGSTKLVAIGDAFVDRAKNVLEFLKKNEFTAPKLDVGDHVFGDLDNYKKVIDVLSPGDVVILANSAGISYTVIFRTETKAQSDSDGKQKKR
jgi:hypothetical protein